MTSEILNELWDVRQKVKQQIHLLSSVISSKDLQLQSVIIGRGLKSASEAGERRSTLSKRWKPKNNHCTRGHARTDAGTQRQTVSGNTYAVKGIHKHTHARTETHVQTYASAHTCIYMRTHTQTKKQTHTYTHTCSRSRSRSSTRTYTRPYQ